MQRPELAQLFNCGGGAKAGSVLLDPPEKKNIMGTRFQKILEQACRQVEPTLTLQQFKTILSDYIKRSSQLKGGMAYKRKIVEKHLHKPKSTENNSHSSSDGEGDI